MSEVIRCTLITLSFANPTLSLDGLLDLPLELTNVSIVTIVVCLCTVMWSTWYVNKTRILSCCLSHICKISQVWVWSVLPSVVNNARHGSVLLCNSTPDDVWPLHSRLLSSFCRGSTHSKQFLLNPFSRTEFLTTQNVMLQYCRFTKDCVE